MRHVLQQALVYAAPEAEVYYTDKYFGYIDVVYPGKHIRNIHNKNNTYTAEGVNAYLLMHTTISGWPNSNGGGRNKRAKYLFLLWIFFRCVFGHSQKILPFDIVLRV